MEQAESQDTSVRKQRTKRGLDCKEATASYSLRNAPPSSAGTSSCTGTNKKVKIRHNHRETEPNDTVDKLRLNKETRDNEIEGAKNTSDLYMELIEQIRVTIYGQSMGDAIGLLTEFMDKEKAQESYGRVRDSLEFKHKIKDLHRDRWANGDWTDDTDQMILIMQSLADNKGKVSGKDFALKLLHWSKTGFRDLGDTVGIGIGSTTHRILSDRHFRSNPQKAAEEIWKQSCKTVAPNGAVMRTCILGIHEFWDLEKVQRNAKEICVTTHFDPRCQASVIAVCVAISLMLQRKPPYFDLTTRKYDITQIIKKCNERASSVLDAKQKQELDFALTCSDIEKLKLDDRNSIGYTFKCLGAGFWALKQSDFRQALTEIVMCGGDADTNGAVAGALLGCKLGRTSKLPCSWFDNLKHKTWLNKQIER